MPEDGKCFFKVEAILFTVECLPYATSKRKNGISNKICTANSVTSFTFLDFHDIDQDEEGEI